MMKKNLLHSIAIILICLSACRQNSETKSYIFLGHPYDWASDGTEVDPRLETIRYSHYDGVWLGGDVCAKTTEDTTTLAYIDSVFDFKHNDVLWVRGNHDIRYGQTGKIDKLCGHPPFMVTHRQGLTIAILDVLIFPVPQSVPSHSQCKKMDAQLAMFQNIADTITQSSHLIVLHHYGLLTNAMTNHTYDMDTVFNFYQPELIVSCAERGNFEQVLYPIFKKIQERGVQVVFIGGDFGMQQKSFQYRTEAGVWFLGSGINNTVGRPAPEYVSNFNPDSILIINYQPEYQQLSWEFVPLNELVENNFGLK